MERQLQAQELQRGYDYSNIERDRDTGYLKIDAAWITYTMRELAEIYELQDEVPRS